MKRYRYAVGLAIAGTAALAIPAIGSATSSTTAIACDAATFTYRDFGATGQAPAPYSITVDGLPFKSGTLTPAGPLSVFTVPLNLQGAHVVTATTQGTATNAFSTATTSVSCPTPAPPPAIVVPPVTPPSVTPPPEPPVRIVTCADLREVGAGRKWLVRHNCIRKVPPRLTCADLRARGVGRSYLARRGCLRIPGPFRDVPVTG